MNNTISINTSKLPIFPVCGDKMTLRYDYTNNSHMVYVGLQDSVRRICFANKPDAIDFISRMNTYCKLKMEV